MSATASERLPTTQCKMKLGGWGSRAAHSGSPEYLRPSNSTTEVTATATTYFI